MSRTNNAIVIIALAAASLTPATAAFAQAGCDWYAATALKQQQENSRLGCGLAGPAWTMDLKGHAAWCANVAPDLAKREAQTREQQLQSCGKGK